MRSVKKQRKFNGTPEQAVEEFILIRRRLKEMGYDGDCAYEKALVAFYCERLEQCSQIIQHN